MAKVIDLVQYRNELNEKALDWFYDKCYSLIEKNQELWNVADKMGGLPTSEMRACDYGNICYSIVDSRQYLLIDLHPYVSGIRNDLETRLIDLAPEVNVNIHILKLPKKKDFAKISEMLYDIFR